MPFVQIVLALSLLVTACQSAPEKATAPTGDVALPVEIRQMLDRYEQMGLTLAADSTTGIADASQAMIAAANKFVGANVSAVEKAAVMSVAPVAQTLLQATQSNDIALVRSSFGELSRAMVSLAQAFPSMRTEHMLMQCPMVTNGFNQWIQRQGKVRNPYKGRAMIDCGSQEDWQ